MKIAFLSGMQDWSWGGSEILWCRTAEVLLAAGHQVMISLGADAEKFPEIRKLRDSGATVVQHKFINASRKNRLVSKLLTKSPKTPGFQPAWDRVLGFQPDLVFISDSGIYNSLHWMESARDSGLPFVSVAHANAIHWWPNDHFASRVAKAYRAARKCFFVSQANLEMFRMQFGEALSDAEIVRNPFNVPWEVDLPWPTRAAEAPWKLACVGRLCPEAKGQDLLIGMLAMEKWRSRALEVTCFGEGPWKKSLQKWVLQHGLDKTIRFAGHVSGVEMIWRDHHALIMPSRYEGLPLSIVEAMLCGRPAIVTDVAGMTEVVEDGETGFVAEYPSVKSLDSAMERAYLARDRWQEMGQRAAQRIRELVPRDPAGELAQRLITLTEQSEKVGS